jgi:hypothetical protein
MGDIVSVTSSGSLSLFALYLCGLIIAGLISVLVWLVRDRIAARRRYDATLEKRLQAGSGKMEGMERDVRLLQIQMIELTARAVEKDDCVASRHDLRLVIDRVTDSSTEVMKDLVRLDARVEEGLRQTSRLLAKLIHIVPLEADDK